ncbi:DUF1566 domain-containing protein [Methylobacter sp. S3L5C]|uniref:Lcl C-terminal domain-containing protein n=1 Tax=Methylobacter sp. S3L5C TaxID=2839024 RepID=UPI001FAD617F|nr:DUF1566 domain-containing protein [Methylobacter sp. S3L5C]UOA08722.1 DUF1566 domain-containing protein [Methylobacter sp. S3L5C]
MQYKKIALAFALLASTIVTGTAQAALWARTGGMVYDDVNNITWAADANLFQTQAASNPNMVSDIIAANGGVIHDTANYYDGYTGIYNLTSADFNTSTGTMTWFGAQAWVNNLTLGGVTGWSLPSTPVKADGINVTSSQMGDLFYNQLGGAAWTDIETTHNANYDLFTNVQSYVYWSGSEYAPDPSAAWGLNTSSGYQGAPYKFGQFYAWAVRPGDVAAVPVPGAFWLFGSAMVGLMGLKRRKNIA